MHIGQLKIIHNIQNSYMFQCQGTNFRESKALRFASTNTTILEFIHSVAYVSQKVHSLFQSKFSTQ